MSVFLPQGTVLAGASNWIGTLSKVVMVVNQLYEHPDCEWLFFTDDDSYINTGMYSLLISA